MIKTTITEKVVTETVFETTDGKRFDSIHEAQFHQDILDGKKKICPTCLGKKQTLHFTELFQSVGYDNGGYPTSIKEDWRVCEKCSGRGYLELKFA